jgi:hypothetical protein
MSEFWVERKKKKKAMQANDAGKTMGKRCFHEHPAKRNVVGGNGKRIVRDEEAEG